MNELLYIPILKEDDDPACMKSRMKRNGTKGLRKKLFRENPHCHWCETLTILVGEPPGKKGASNMATIDHIISRYRAISREQYVAPENMVLSCHKCNQDRSQEESRQIQIEVQRRKNNEHSNFIG